jgi:outer membrane receptor protein involved in Fe transport
MPDIQKFAKQFDIWNPNSTNAGNLAHTNDYAAGTCMSSATPNTSASSCGAYHLGIEPHLTQNGSVRENDYGGWLQVNWDTLFYGVPFRGNSGGRYVLTEQAATGYVYTSTTDANGYPNVVITANTVSQTYHDILPSLNAVFEPSDDFLIRFNASLAMSRPGLTSLLPGGSANCASSNNRNCIFGLEWCVR